MGGDLRAMADGVPAQAAGAAAVFGECAAPALPTASNQGRMDWEGTGWLAGRAEWAAPQEDLARCITSSLQNSLFRRWINCGLTARANRRQW